MKFALFPIFVALFGCATPAADQRYPDGVSLVQLIIDPEYYLGKMIAVSGFLDAFGTRLYLTKHHYDLVDGASSIRVSIGYVDEDVSKTTYMATGCENKYVQIAGYFNEYGKGNYLISDIFLISEARDMPSPGPPRRSCFERTDAIPWYASPEN